MKRDAFTLVELAIVLVIIGLIVGGVLVGQDLINAARIRSAIGDIERFNGAASTFQEKYQGLPGDLINTKATRFGFNTTDNDVARDGTGPGLGNGNGRIEGSGDVSGTVPSLGGETALFWSDLSKAGLIKLSSPLTSTNATLQPFTNAELGNRILPRSKLRDTAIFAIYSYDVVNSTFGSNRFALGQIYCDGSGGTFNLVNSSSGLTPLEAYSIDQKLDDGRSTSGMITTIIDKLAPDTTGPCTDGNGGYNTSVEANANANTCALSIRPAF